MDSLTRRGLLAAGAGVAGLAALGGAPAFAAKDGKTAGAELPKLPYGYDALEPVIDKQTLTLHHDKHHAGYVKGFNNALARLAEARKSGDFGLVKHWERELAFHGSGHVLHTIYWDSMSPEGSAPSGKLAAAIQRDFGSLDAMTAQFKAATGAVEASGWGVLAWVPVLGSLAIFQAEKHQDLTVWGAAPLMVCDVWEHAYYLKYQNRRGEYVDRFCSIVDWAKVGKRFDAIAM